jgi:hypothetical protein
MIINGKIMLKTIGAVRKEKGIVLIKMGNNSNNDRLIIDKAIVICNDMIALANNIENKPEIIIVIINSGD